MNKKLSICIVMGIIMAAFCVVYGSYLHFKHGPHDRAKHDFMNINLMRINNHYYSGWPFSHLILYIIFGFMCPEKWFIILSLGGLWELMEMGMSYTQKDEHKKQFLKEKGNVSNIYDENWWAGTWTDLVFNFIGFAIGVTLRMMMKTGIQGPYCGKKGCSGKI